MNRFENFFENAKKINRIAFMPFLVSGYPDFEKSIALAKCVASFADGLEIGFPFSDPISDGPVITQANSLALKNGFNLHRGFSYIKKIRKFFQGPITIMLYANLVHNFGLEKFYKSVKLSGADAVLIPDLPVDEAKEYIFYAKKFDLRMIFIVTSNMKPKKMHEILKNSDTFLYVVSVLGVTGSRKFFPKSTFSFLQKMTKTTQLPRVVGFGVSSSEQINILKKYKVEGVIIGSEILKRYEVGGIKKVKTFLKNLDF